MIKIFGLRIYTKSDFITEWVDGIECKIPKDVRNAIVSRFNLIRQDIYRMQDKRGKKR